MKGCSGELSLRVGDEPFGLINIGDDASFFRLCEEESAFDTESDEFATSLFGTLNRKESPLHILYPRLEALATQDTGNKTSTASVRNQGKLPKAVMEMFDFDRIYLAVQDFKMQRSMSNLRLAGEAGRSESAAECLYPCADSFFRLDQRNLHRRGSGGAQSALYERSRTERLSEKNV
jgi:hypothetical protein